MDERIIQRFANMIEQYQDCLNDIRVFTGYVRDLFPDERLMGTILINLYEQGITDEIRGTDDLDDVLMQRCLNRLVGEYGTDKGYATEAIKIWFSGYGGTILNKEVNISVLNSNSTVQDENQPDIDLKVSEEDDIQRIHDLDKYINKDGVLDLSTPNRRGENISVIPNGAFIGEERILEAELYGVKEIGDKAFYSCKNLEKIGWGSDILKIGNRAFMGCDRLEFFTLPPRDIEIIGDFAFSKSGIWNIDFIDEVKQMGKGVFKDCKELSVSCFSTERLTVLPAETFLGCVKLAEEILPESIKRIESRAYYGCVNLDYIDIPEGTEYIAEDAFDNINPEIKVYCTKGSLAEKYAKEHNLKIEIKSDY